MYWSLKELEVDEAQETHECEFSAHPKHNRKCVEEVQIQPSRSPHKKYQRHSPADARYA